MITATVTGVDKRPSRFGGDFFYVYFKGIEDGKSYRTCIYPKCRNFVNWAKIINRYEKGVSTTLSNLVVKNGTLIDADSMPKIIEGDKQV